MSNKKHPYLEEGKTITVEALYKIDSSQEGKRIAEKFIKELTSESEKLNRERKGKDSMSTNYVFDNSKKSFSVPLKREGGLVRILDNEETNVCPDVQDTNGKPKKLTQQQYFEHQLGANLSTLNLENNFWQTDKDYRHIVTIEGGQLILDLGTPLGMLKYHILRANKRYIAESPESLKVLKLPTHQFVMVEEGYSDDNQAENLDREIKLYEAFTSIMKSDDDAKDFLRLCGSVPPANASTKQLKAAVGNVMKKTPDHFMKVYSDPNKEEKLFIARAVEVGGLYKNGSLYKTTDGKNLGTLESTIKFLNDKENSALYEHINAMIEEKLYA